MGTETVIVLPGGAVNLTLTYIPPGTFMMGSPADERGRFSTEDLHAVTLTRGFYLGATEVTQAQWQAVMGTPPQLDCNGGLTSGVGPDYPVYCQSWNAIAGPGGFIATLNAHLGSTAYRLPTEAEWERAARAGTQTPFSFGDDVSCSVTECTSCDLYDEHMLWCGSETYDAMAQPVGSRLANAFGLFDMHGNVNEFVQDWYQSQLGTAAATDPTGPTTTGWRTHRGGSWNSLGMGARSASRDCSTPTDWDHREGFRLARTAD